jgi:hypothetical protein
MRGYLDMAAAILDLADEAGVDVSPDRIRLLRYPRVTAAPFVQLSIDGPKGVSVDRVPEYFGYSEWLVRGNNDHHATSLEEAVAGAVRQVVRRRMNALRDTSVYLPESKRDPARELAKGIGASGVFGLEIDRLKPGRYGKATLDRPALLRDVIGHNEIVIGLDRGGSQFWRWITLQRRGGRYSTCSVVFDALQAVADAIVWVVYLRLNPEPTAQRRWP